MKHPEPGPDGPGLRKKGGGRRRQQQQQQQTPAGKLQKLGLAVRAFVEAAGGGGSGSTAAHLPEVPPPPPPGDRRNRRELRREKRKLKRGRRRQRLSGREEHKEAAAAKAAAKGGKPRPTGGGLPCGKGPPLSEECRSAAPPQVPERKERRPEEARRRERPASASNQSSASALARKRALLAANEAEDREIRRLEKQLGLTKRRKKKQQQPSEEQEAAPLPPSFARDGLGYVLGVLDSGGATLAGLYESSSCSEEEGEDGERGEGGGDEEAEEGEAESEEGGLSEEEEEEEEALSVEEEGMGGSEEPSSDQESDHRPPHCRSPETGAMEPPRSLQAKEEENHQVATKYVPPQMRKSEDSVDAKKMEELERLKKTLKGLINRLSEPNLASISGQLEELYMLNSRKDMNETLTSMLIAACVTTTAMPSRLVMEHVLLISILHQTVGIEVGAHFLETVVRKFDDVYRSEVEGKECENLLVLIANLYNFHVVHSLLIFDILKKLVKTFSEKDIELILLLLKNVGFSLRKDDPLGLKELITEAQKKASTIGKQFHDQSRVSFMLETMLALKNNDMRKIPGYDPEPVEKLRKLQRALIHSSSSGKDAQLRVSLESLLSADQIGRWWIVGSSWSGAPMVDNTSNKLQQILPKGKVSSKILELARKQRMNTDIRRNIFCILMTSEDFLDAFEKLLKLRLKDQQEREIVHVLVDCCLQEKTYNPFYAYLSAKFCEYERRFQKTFQFSIWDKIRDLGNLSTAAFSNLVNLLTHLLKSRSLSLTVFKVIEFSELDKPKVLFLRQVLSALLLKTDPEELDHIFGKLAENPKLGMLHEGLKLFLTHFLLKNIQAHKNADEAIVLKEKIELVTNVLKAKESKLKL